MLQGGSIGESRPVVIPDQSNTYEHSSIKRNESAAHLSTVFIMAITKQDKKKNHIFFMSLFQKCDILKPSVLYSHWFHVDDSSGFITPGCLSLSGHMEADGPIWTGVENLTCDSRANTVVDGDN